MNGERDRVAARVAREILPHEGLVRNWLRRQWGSVIDIDDVIQEAYCRIASLPSLDHIDNVRSYFFRTVQAVATDNLRRAKVESIRRVTEIDWLNVIDEEPSADRALEASQELERVTSLLSRLTWTCRRVIELRRIEGLSQKDTARLLGISESVVENHIVRGLKSVLNAVQEPEPRTTEAKVTPLGKRQSSNSKWRR
ncbi:RNA polymerase sigma factor [Steroidobacter cummioxidans]|uniref:RNA polymerase sigma factor n=1 Tax=Steroidobacter cummioxidans TaxID=1803913 RepID=UPI000E317D55|nr:sigma-70 family RNA polymerase sigma factor [Steroidobacter cummioxidans]